jgi:hypothetical protein
MSRRLDTVLLPAGSSAVAAGEATPLAQSERLAVDVIWGINVTAGVVAIDSGPYKGYTGAWTNLATFTIGAGSVAASMDQWRGSGPFGAIRARITTIVNGAGVQVVLHEN